MAGQASPQGKTKGSYRLREAGQAAGILVSMGAQMKTIRTLLIAVATAAVVVVPLSARAAPARITQASFCGSSNDQCIWTPSFTVGQGMSLAAFSAGGQKQTWQIASDDSVCGGVHVIQPNPLLPNFCDPFYTGSGLNDRYAGDGIGYLQNVHDGDCVDTTNLYTTTNYNSCSPNNGQAWVVDTAGGYYKFMSVRATNAKQTGHAWGLGRSADGTDLQNIESPSNVWAVTT